MLSDAYLKALFVWRRFRDWDFRLLAFLITKHGTIQSTRNNKQTQNYGATPTISNDDGRASRLCPTNLGGSVFQNFSSATLLLLIPGPFVVHNGYNTARYRNMEGNAG
jgi:hypothetical protein